MNVRINVGCGQSPTPGWLNYDNSLAVLLSRYPLAYGILSRLRLLDAGNISYIEYCRKNSIKYAHAAKRIPHAASSVSVVYSSHMLEHLERRRAGLFIAECHRVLAPGGTLRLALPDFDKLVVRYLDDKDVDAFLEACQFDLERPGTFSGRLRRLLMPWRNHHWMYNGQSLVRLLEAHGFVNVRCLPGGETTIDAPSPLNLAERHSESVYVEGMKKTSP